MEQLERLYSLEELAELFGTGVRFPRRLVAQRRIRFVHVGRYVRVPQSAVQEYLANGAVEVVRRPRGMVV